MEKVNLDELVGGGLQEKFESALNTVVENMQDPNTPWKNKRAITIKLTFEQNEDRNDTEVNISVETKTAPVKPIVTRMAIGKDLKTGEVYAQEYGNQVQGQIAFASSPQKPNELIIGEKLVDPETGEIKEPAQKVVNMRGVKQA